MTCDRNSICLLSLKTVMDFKGVCTVLAAILCFYIAAGRKSKCLDSIGNLKCAYPQLCLDKKQKNCPAPYTGKGCKCKKPKGCFTNYFQPGCDNGLVCVKKNHDVCSDFRDRKCSCAAGCWTSHYVPGCDSGQVCMKRIKQGKFATCSPKSYLNKQCYCHSGCKKFYDTGCGDGEVCLDKKLKECAPSKFSSKKCFCAAGCMTSRFTPGCDYGKVCMKKNFDQCSPGDYSNKECSCNDPAPTGCWTTIRTPGCDLGKICMKKNPAGRLVSGNTICSTYEMSHRDCSCIEGCFVGVNSVRYGILSTEPPIELPQIKCKYCKCIRSRLFYDRDVWEDYCFDKPACNVFLQALGKR